jgi:hypothetical protein
MLPVEEEYGKVKVELMVVKNKTNVQVYHMYYS